MRLIRRLLILAIVGVAGVAAYAYWSGARDTCRAHDQRGVCIGRTRAVARCIPHRRGEQAAGPDARRAWALLVTRAGAHS